MSTATNKLEPNIPPKGPIGMKDDYVTIILDDNPDIVGLGLPVSINGFAYMIKPGVPVEVPKAVVDVLNDAVMSYPVQDNDTKQVIGYRNRLRYSFRQISR